METQQQDNEVGWRPMAGARTEEPFYAWHPNHGIVLVFWECGCFRINQACYPAAYDCTHRWCGDESPPEGPLGAELPVEEMERRERYLMRDCGETTSFEQWWFDERGGEEPKGDEVESRRSLALRAYLRGVRDVSIGS